MLSYLGLMKQSRVDLVFIIISMSFFIIFSFLRKASLEKFISKDFNHIWRVELISLIIFSFLILIYGFHPEVFYGEKPMDYSLFFHILRSEELPIMDPWFGGNVLRYYYWGHTFFTSISKIIGTSPETGLTLSLATIGMLLSSNLYSLILFLTRQKNLSFIFSLLLVLSSNFKAFWDGFVLKRAMNLSFLFSNTRVFNDKEFSEYPSWSLLFGDLHPHVMSYPFCIMFLLFLFYGLKYIGGDFSFKKNFSFMILYSLCFGALLAINGWDYITYSFFGGFFFILSFDNLTTIRKFSFYFSTQALSLILFFPMLHLYLGGSTKKMGRWEGAKNDFVNHFNHSGLWWVILITLLLPLFLRKRKWSLYPQTILSKFIIVSLFCALLAENFFFMDRVNTIFKIFNNFYIWSAIISCICFRYFRFYTRRIRFIPLTAIASCLLLILLGGTFYNLKALFAHRTFKNIGDSLLGGNFLYPLSIGDKEIVSWALRKVKGNPTLVERYSDSYDIKGSRISTYTGIPNYLGWDHHVYIRGQKWNSILERKKDIDFIYHNKDPLKVYEFMLSKGLHFLVVGDFEKKYYPSIGLEKFNKYRDIFVPLVTKDGSTLYGIGNYQLYIKKDLIK